MRCSMQQQFTARLCEKVDDASWFKGAVQHLETTAKRLGCSEARKFSVDSVVSQISLTQLGDRYIWKVRLWW